MDLRTQVRPPSGSGNPVTYARFGAVGTTLATVLRSDGARVRPPDPADVPLRRRSYGWGALSLLLGWAAQVAVRLWLSSGQSVPVATPDETGYLFALRVLSGGAGADMSPGTIYRGGYPLLLLPATWISDDPVTVFHACLAINALVSAAMFPLAYLLLRRLGLTRALSQAVGHVTALLPAVAFFAEFVLTDAVLPVVMIGWLLLTHSWLTAGPHVSRFRVALYGAGAAAAAGYVYVCHARGVIVVLVHAGLLIVAALRRWRSWRGVLLSAAVLAGVVVVGALLNRSLLPYLYPQGDNHLGDNLARRLTSVDGYGWTLSVGTGQIWYQIVASGGPAGIGLAALAATAFRKGAEPRLRALSLALLALIAGVAFATAAALPVEYRVGNYAYGRYLAFISPVLFAIGAVVLLRARPRVVLRAAAATAVAAVATAGVIQVYAGDLLSRYTFTLYDFPETSFLTLDWTSFRLWRATLVCLVLLALAVVAVRISKHGALVMVAVLAAMNLAAVTTATMRISRPLARDLTAASDLRGVPGLASQRSIAIDWNVPWTIRMSQFFWAWGGTGRTFDARWAQPPRDADLVVLAWPKGAPATATWPTAPPGWSVALAKRSDVGDWVVWRRPSTGRSSG